MTAIALSLLLATTSPAEVELRWNAPPACPDAGAFEARVAKYLEGTQQSDERVEVEASIVRDGERWRLRLATTVGDEKPQQRELTDPDCDGLTESAAVLVAIAVSPELAGTVPPPIDAVEPVDEEPTDAEPVEPRTSATAFEPETTTVSSTPTIAPEPAPAPRPPTHASLRVFGGGSLGWLPPGGDVGLALAVFWYWVRIEVTGVYAIRRSVRFDDQRDAGVDVSAWAIGARACAVLHPVSWLETPLCAGAEAGQVIGAPVRLINGRPGRPTWLAAVVAPSLRFEAHPRVAVWASPELVVTIARPTLDVSGEDTPLFQSAPVGGRFYGGIELRFF